MPHMGVAGHKGYHDGMGLSPSNELLRNPRAHANTAMVNPR